MGGPGDTVVTGDWTCSGAPTAVLLRAATGDVFAFDGWATAAADVEGRPLARVAGAVDLRVGDADGDGCDDLEVARSAGDAVRVDPRPAPSGPQEAG